MAYYNICPICGAHLDPGEPCDCKDNRTEEKTRRLALPTEVEPYSGQLRMVLRREKNEAINIF